MTIETISSRLLELLEKKAFLRAQEELFDKDVISMEPAFHPNPITRGLDQLMKKETLFLKSIESWEAFHLSGPLISSNHFSIQMYTKVLMRTGQTIEVDELIVYEVASGKITRESFFYRQT